MEEEQDNQTVEKHGLGTKNNQNEHIFFITNTIFEVPKRKQLHMGSTRKY